MERRFRIDLTKIEGDGEFNCPACGATISPDDYSGLTYSILDIKTKDDGGVEEVIVQCGTCEDIICLGGFDLIEDSSYSNEYSSAKEHVSSLRTM